MEQDPRWGNAGFGRQAPPFGTRPAAPQLDMTPDGQFRGPAAPPIAAKVIGVGILLAVMAGTLALAAVALWFAMMLVPVAIGAALVAYVAFKFRQWRMGSLGGHPLVRRNPFGR